MLVLVPSQNSIGFFVPDTSVNKFKGKFRESGIPSCKVLQISYTIYK